MLDRSALEQDDGRKSAPNPWCADEQLVIGARLEFLSQMLLDLVDLRLQRIHYSNVRFHAQGHILR